MISNPECYLIPEYKSRRHHLMENGELDPISTHIDCWDQILYTVLLNYDVDLINYFYGCINVECYESQEHCGLRRIEEDVNRDFNVGVIEHENVADCIMEIEGVISSGLPVAMTTMFDMIPNFFWYKEGLDGIHNGHSTLLVGYDKEYFYIVDSPLVFNKERDILYSENDTLHMVHKSHIVTALSKYRILNSIQYKEEAEDKEKPIREELKKMAKVYYSSSAKYIRGKKALELYKQIIEDDQNWGGKCGIIDHYEVHLIYARHVLLKWNIEKNEIMKQEWNLILEKLNTCITNWFTLKMIIEKYELEKELLREKILKQLRKIIANEEALITAMGRIS